MMDFAVLVAVALFATVFASVIFGKELDEKEKQAIAKEKIESKKEKAQVARKSQGKWNIK